MLWIAGGNLPAGLALALPSGSRRPAPVASSVLAAGPAYFSEGTGGVLLESVVPHSRAARLYAGVVERELFRDLRQEGGYSYTAATAYEARGDGYTTVTAFADALPARQDAVLGGFLDVLARLGVGRIEPSDLEAVRTRTDAALTAPDAAPGRLPAAAEDLLLGVLPRGADELRAELWAVTPAHLEAVATEAMGTALMQVPSGLRADWAGFTQVSGRSSYTVDGRLFASLRKDGSALLVAGEGVSMTLGGESVTVLFRDCVAVLGWPDGGRRLIGRDGTSVAVEPGLYGVDPATMATIDAAVHPSAAVRLEPRRVPSPGDPSPAAAGSPGRAGGRRPTRRTGGQTAMVIIFGVLAVVWSCAALLITVFAFADPTTSLGILLVMCVFLWGIAALLAWPAVRILRRTRRL